MSLSGDSKSNPSSDHAMREVFTEGQSFTLPDGKGAERVEIIRAALSSYYETRRPPKQTPSSQPNPAAAAASASGAGVGAGQEMDAKDIKSPLPASGTSAAGSGSAAAATTDIRSSVTPTPGRKSKVIKPIRERASHDDPSLPKTFTNELGLLSDIKHERDMKPGTIYLGEKNGHVIYTVKTSPPASKINSGDIPALKAPKPFNLVELNKLKYQICLAAYQAKHIETASVTNSKSNLFKLPRHVLALVSDGFNTSMTESVNRSCRETNRLFQNQMKDEYKEKQPLLQKLLQYVVDADKDQAEEFIKWHYRFQLVTDEEKIPDLLEKDVIYVEKAGNDLKYSLTTSDGKCSVKDRTITLAELNEAQKSIHADAKDKKADQKIEIPAEFTKDHLKALRPLILAITHKNKYTEPKNNRCLLTMKGMVGCDLVLMTEEKKDEKKQDSDPNHLCLYRRSNGLVYFINGQEHTFENLAITVEIAKLFDDKGLNKNGVLANNNLKWPQIEACKALLAETAKRGHSSYVYSGHRIKGTALQMALGAEDVSRATHPDEGMAEMLMDELRKLPEGETHIRKQTDAQFVEGWEAKEEKRHEEDVKALRKFRKAITDAKASNDPNLIAATAEWKEYLEPKGMTETGKHWNARLKYIALQIGWAEWYYDTSWKNDLFYNVGVGSIDTHAPTNWAMAEAQGLGYLLKDGGGEKFNRSLKYRHSNGSYYPLSFVPGFHLGSDSWVESYYGELRDVRVNRLHGRKGGDGSVFGNLMSSKNISVAKFMQRPSQQSKAGCTIM